MSVITLKTENGKVTLDTAAKTVYLNKSGSSQGGQVLGASASVESAGEISRRVTATRMVATGLFALALQKKKDDRELYLMVEGPTYSFVAQCDPKDGAEARKFAASINTAAKGGYVATPGKPKSTTKQWSDYTPAQQRAFLWVFAGIALIFLVAILVHQ